MGIHVKATRLGYFGMQRIREGETFEVPNEAAFSERWMKKVKAKVRDEDEETESPVRATSKARPTASRASDQAKI